MLISTAVAKLRPKLLVRPARPGRDMARKPVGKTEEAESGRAEVRAWLEAIMARRKVDERAIATASGVNLSTIYRWLDPESTISPQLKSVRQVARAFDMPPPGGAAYREFAESDATPFLDAPPESLRPQSPNQYVWRIGNRALELAGVEPGDLVLLDKAAPARAGDIVIAKIHDFERGSAEPKIRYFDGFCLATRTMDPSLSERSIPVDGERAVVMGRIIRLLRLMG